MSCSWTGRLICSRVGSDITLPDAPSKVSHAGTPRPFTSSIAWTIVAFFSLLAFTVTTSPARSE
jgi:hypothetical protein